MDSLDESLLQMLLKLSRVEEDNKQIIKDVKGLKEEQNTLEERLDQSLKVSWTNSTAQTLAHEIQYL